MTAITVSCHTINLIFYDKYLFLWHKKNMFSTRYLYDNRQWWLSCEFFVWQPTVTAAKNGQKPPKTDQKPPKIVKNHQTQSTPPKFWTRSIFLWPVLPERKKRRKKLNNLESFKENQFFLDPFTNFFLLTLRKEVLDSLQIF